ncbi:MAG: PQQ-dependent sugar dehydrogenase [Burkholderiales bacterium]|nr:PQQ-dependent sugar dehydrogenase [Burkholderiales bacterium]
MPVTSGQFALNVIVQGTGAGSVASVPAGIGCGNDCSETYPQGTSVTLTATPQSGSSFSGWSGVCSGTGTCTVAMSATRTAIATFAANPAPTHMLTTVVTGSGSVGSLPAGITCPTDCTEAFTAGTNVTLTATPATGFQFTGWSGAGCPGTGTCVVAVNAATSVTATFTPVATGQFALQVITQGSGSVASSPAGIACGSDCSETYPQNTSVTLSATPLSGATFSGWSGACAGTGACTVVMSATRTVTATFTQITRTLTVTKAGTGVGTVTSAPTGINCGSDCTEAYAQGTGVTLTAAASTGSTFAGWSGAGCSGVGTCVASMTAATTATATFTANATPTHLLTVTVTGSGGVGSSPAGIACPSDCTESYTVGTNVILTAAPAAGFQFAGWSGACTGTGSCAVALNAPTGVTATFTPVAAGQFALNVAVQGLGSVTSTPAGISCGSDCSETYAQATSVTLTAAPQSGATFSGWSGACAGTGACTVVMSATRTVTATFTPIMRTLTVTKAGTGAGTVTSAPAGINCGTDCTEAYAQGTSVTLTAAASAGSTFAGWSGACTGTGSCAVNMAAAATATATFTTNPTPTHVLTVVVNGSGGVGSSPVGITCPTDCTESFTQGTIVTLAATPTSGQQFTGWGGACTGASTCTVTMNAAASVTATFAASTTLGLTSRPDNTSCRSFDPSTTSTASLTLQRTFSALSFSEPIAMLQAPNDSSRWFVVEKGGVVRVFANDTATTSSSVFIDISALVFTYDELEAGLLGMAFDPNFGTGAGKNQNFYLFYSGERSSGYRMRSNVARFTANANATSATTASRVALIGLDKDESNHNGGNIAFGPNDGYLYIGFGDGGGAPNPQAQDDKFLFGKMLRINPNGTTGGVPYSIPSDNPNAGNPGLCNATGRGASSCPEVWARGLRNPWRWSFDKANGTLWVADVGWGSFEEVNIVNRNGNYGWPITEGAACVTGGCNRTGLTDPVYALPRDDAQAITGGYVYRGSQTTDLAGQYIFGDFASKMFGAVIAGSGGTYTGRYLINPYAASSINVSSFGEGSDGELFALDYVGGGIHRLAFSNGSGGGSPVVPTLLSATGCVNASNPRLPAAGMVGYDLNAPFWSDNAEKERFFAMPSTTASFTPGTDGDWTTPLRSVIVKNFRLGTVMIETRLLMRQSNGDWAGYSYEWNDAQTDATLVAVGGKEKTLATQVWSYPSRAQCLQCHTSAAGFSLGLETQQLNKNFTYSQTGINAHQLSTLSAPAIAMLTPQITNPAAQAKLANPFGTDSLDLRARAYLHTNCAMCHRPGGSTGVGLNLLASTALAQTGTCNLDPTKGTLGLTNAKIIAPGLPDSSVLLARANSRVAQEQMPPIGSHVVDANGVALLRQWISGLATCN